MTDLSDFRREALAHSRTAESLPTMDDAGPRPGWERRAITFANGAEWAAKKLLARIAKVEALHHKITRYGNVRYSISDESYTDDLRSYEDLEPFDLCAECYEVEKLICEECGGDAPIGHRSSWPCPTKRALTEGENE